MMMYEKRLVPLVELPNGMSFEPGRDTVSWDFTLPPSVDPERLVMNLHAFQRIQSVAAFASSHIVQSVYGHSDLGYDNEQEPAVLSDPESPDKLPMKMYFKTVTTHELDKPEIAAGVVRTIEMIPHVSRELAWAYQLNKALRHSVNDAAYRHLVSRETPGKRMLHTLIAVPMAMSFEVSARIGDMSLAGEWAALYGGAYAALIGIDSTFMKRRSGEFHFSDRRWSVNPFGTWQPDRYMAVAVMSTVHPLIGYRS
jgi:hypothetical protein